MLIYRGSTIVIHETHLNENVVCEKRNMNTHKHYYYNFMLLEVNSYIQ
jgi:hypothetical protein